MDALESKVEEDERRLEGGEEAAIVREKRQDSEEGCGLEVGRMR